MRDSRRMAIEGIEDIDRHLYNFKLLHKFLCTNKNYAKFKNIFFLFQNRSYVEVIRTIAGHRGTCPVWKCSSLNRIDRNWSGFFNYIPFSGGVWSKYHLCVSEMMNFCDKWGKYIDEHNYDKFINKRHDNTFELNGGPFEIS
jgi:hypothetical protein